MFVAGVAGAAEEGEEEERGVDRAAVVVRGVVVAVGEPGR